VQRFLHKCVAYGPLTIVLSFAIARRHEPACGTKAKCSVITQALNVAMFSYILDRIA